MNYPEVKFGISSWTFPWSVGVANGPQPSSKLTVMDLLRKAIELDVKLLQVADNIPLETLSQEDLDEFSAVAKEQGISIEIGTKGIDVNHLFKFLDIAKFLNSSIIRILPGSINGTANMGEVENSMKRILPAFEKAGVTIVIENYEAFTALEYLELMQKINHPNLRMCIDLANALGKMEGPYFFMEKLAPYCANFHYKDIEIIRSPSFLGFKVIGKPSGQGNIPIKWAMTELMKYNLYPSLIIECWPQFKDTIEETIKMENEWAEESVRFMKTLQWGDS